MHDIAKNRTSEIIAVEIKSLEAQGTAMFLSVVAEIGKRLLEVKALLPHGQWGKWLEENVQYSERTAQQYMKIAQEYHLEKTKPDSFLNFSQAIALLTLPQDKRAQFIEENDIESMSKRELQKAIQAAKVAEKRAKEAEEKAAGLAKEKSETEQQRAEIETEYQHMKENLHQMIGEKMNLENQKILLEDEFQSLKIVYEHAQLDHRRLLEKIAALEAAPPQPDDAVQIQSLRAALEASKAQIAELTEKLQQPVTVETAVVETVPAATMQELEQLRAENERLRMEPQSSEARTELKCRVQLEAFKLSFNQLRAAIGVLSDEACRQKYEAVAAGILAEMSAKL